MEGFVNQNTAGKPKFRPIKMSVPLYNGFPNSFHLTVLFFFFLNQMSLGVHVSPASAILFAWPFHASILIYHTSHTDFSSPSTCKKKIGVCAQMVDAI